MLLLLLAVVGLFASPSLGSGPDDFDITGTSDFKAPTESVEPYCMPLASITSLSLHPGFTTTRRRTSNVPTLNCVGNCPEFAFLSGAQCTQTGISDNGLPSWVCIGNFPSNGRERFALGNIRVQCEGCKKAGDTNVVRGSCSLTYSVVSHSLGRYRRHSREASAADFFLWLLVMSGIFACCILLLRRARHGPEPGSGVYTGTVVDEKTGAVHHHHHHGGYPGSGYGGGSGSGFGSGMLTGVILGDMMSRHGGGGYYHDHGSDMDYEGGGGGGWSGGGGGFGGSDSV